MARARRSWWRWLVALVLGLAAASAGVVAWLALAAAGDTAPHPFNQDRNATWLEHRWLTRPHPTPEMEDLLRHLDGRGIRYVFPHLIPFDAEGRLPPHDREQLRAFLATARRVAPRMRVLPWVGGLRVGYKRSRVGVLDLADIAQRQRIVAECRGLIDEGFDGIHLNIEPVNEGNVEFLALLRALRTAVGPQRILSLSSIRPGPVTLPFAPNFLWSLDYYSRVGAVADQIVVMAYDTALPTAPAYRRYVAWASRQSASALHEGPGRATVLMGVPTYEDNGLMHRAGVETLANALAGVVAGLRGSGTGGTFEGVALYAEWTTDDVEWTTYDSLWRGLPSPAAAAD